MGSTYTCDVTVLPRLRRQANQHGHRVQGQPAWLLLGDKGFDGNTIQPSDLIPPIRRGGNLLAPERCARAELVSMARLDGVYGQRWICETVNSVIKIKFGGTVRSRSVRLQQRSRQSKWSSTTCTFSLPSDLSDVCDRALISVTHLTRPDLTVGVK